MKKIIALLLTLSLLLCANAIVYATEGDDGSNEPIAAIGDVSETSVESSTEAEAAPTDDTNEAEISAPAKQADEPETSDPAAESGTPETTEPTDESTAPVDDASIEDSEVSEEPAGNEAEGNMQPANNAEPVSNGEMLGEPSPAAVNDITITWKGMVFTYREATIGTWDPDHAGGPDYVDAQPAGWTSNDPDNPDCGTLTVTANNTQGEESVLVHITYTPEGKWSSGTRAGLVLSEDEGKVTTETPDSASQYWNNIKKFEKTLRQEEMLTVYVRPGVNTATLSDETFKSASAE